MALRPGRLGEIKNSQIEGIANFSIAKIANYTLRNTLKRRTYKTINRNQNT
jgi:hypothetical protein